MKILWFTTNIPEIYNKGRDYNGGGWIRSLLKNFSTQYPDISIGLAFPYSHKGEIIHNKNITYYPLHHFRESKLKKLERYWGVLPSTDYYLCKQEVLNCIESFVPDIIQVFGIEHGLASITEITNIPTIIHLQGLIIPYENAFYPPNFNNYSCLFKGNLVREVLLQNGIMFRKRTMKLMADFEKRRFKNTKFLMGRTEWDYQISSLYAPQAKYFKINECLREEIINSQVIVKKKTNNDKEIIITSTLSPTFYKGFDTILKTAKILKDDFSINYKWNLIGISKEDSFIKLFEKQCKIQSSNYPISFKGTLNGEDLKKELLNSDIFIHPSYIDNSPNSICEAQITGIPIIAANVGGVSSLIEHKVTGILVPANSPHEIVYWIKELTSNHILKSNIIKNATETAKDRHNPTKICSDLLKVYKTILNNHA